MCIVACAVEPIVMSKFTREATAPIVGSLIVLAQVSDRRSLMRRRASPRW